MKTRYAFTFAALLVAAYAALTYCTACFPADQKVEAAGAYEAQQLACLSQYADKPSIDKCRNDVKAAWAADAGKDAAK